MTFAEVAESVFRRTENVVDAIERDDGSAAEALRVLYETAPWDVVRLGQALVLDQLAAEEAADEQIAELLGAG